MLTWLNHRFFGYLFVEMTGFSPERFFNMCSAHEIEVWDVVHSGHTYRFFITVPGFRKIKPLVRKSKVRLRILKKFGLPFFYTGTEEESFMRRAFWVFWRYFMFCPCLSGILNLMGIRCIHMILF